ncbi:MAG TPA: ATP-binding protein [Bryobacteraceae bacterium]|nr:ATP-binding protein [Bryobacteraceae bacterium]
MSSPIRTQETTPAPDLTLRCLLHDLNNVFQTFVEAADLLSADPRWSPVSAAILRSVERGKEISASLETAGQPPVALETVVENAVALVRDSMIAGHGPAVHFVCAVEPDIELPRAWAWERVLINLFSNAVHAMPGGGTIWVRARRTGALIELAVADQGSGIAPELLHSIFEPDVSTRPAGGLGLHIVHTIVTGEQGEVRAVNRAEGGAEFTITFPADARLARSASAQV